MTNEVWTEGNEMKHEQWSADWWKWDETWTVKCGLKEIRWNMNDRVDNVTDVCFWSYVCKCYITLDITRFSNSFSAERNYECQIFLCWILFAFRHKNNSQP